MRVIATTLVLFSLVLLAGCGGEFDPQNDISKDNNENIRRLITCYKTFCSHNGQNGMAGPADEAEFREFLGGEAAQNWLKYINVDGDVDKLMTSERDGKPFKFRWNVRVMRGSDEPIVFEEEGVDGKRMVGFTSFKFVEAHEAQYDDWLAGKYKPGSDGAPSQEVGPNGAGRDEIVDGGAKPKRRR